MSIRTKLNIPAEYIHEVTERMKLVGFVVLDTGERITTEEGIDYEAVLELFDPPKALGPTDVDAWSATVDLGVKA